MAPRPKPDKNRARLRAGVALTALRLGFILAFLGIVLSALIGLHSAFFLWLLERATQFRETHPSIIVGLFLAGALFIYTVQRLGVSNLSISLTELRTEPSSRVRWRLVPLIIFGSVWTHLFGGSAGRESAAVQVGLVLGEHVRRFGERIFGRGRTYDVLTAQEISDAFLLMGMSAGFASIFGTPWAGAVFALEAYWHSKNSQRPYRAGFFENARPLVNPLLFIITASTAWLAHAVAIGVGTQHTNYQQIVRNETIEKIVGTNEHRLYIVLFIYIVIAAILFGLLARCYGYALQGFKTTASKLIKKPLPRIVLGAVALTLATHVLGTTRYVGLGVPTIVEALHTHVPWYDFIAKTVYTILTLGSGFIGGDATPLFFIGSTFGNTLGQWADVTIVSRNSGAWPLGLDWAALLAPLGFGAVFGAIYRAPIASAVMIVELFGWWSTPELVGASFFVCYGAYWVAASAKHRR